MTRKAGFEQRAAGVASADGDARDQSAIAVHVSPLDSHALLVEQSTCVRRGFSAEGFVQLGRVDAFESDTDGLRFSCRDQLEGVAVGDDDDASVEGAPDAVLRRLRFQRLSSRLIVVAGGARGWRGRAGERREEKREERVSRHELSVSAEIAC